ncbi:hypothetical protein [Mucilaginibacter arboris]|uniref:Uncharacterized protein n=1 Tax=Mucilaginibacter arboris TaxID=2682090 RepID=A0A7K1SSA6_9SPHI|nr:hypothetical protein [Mucilaginibacter arboris]MVN19980.1 hypothetical protein [Mucilaginibacter arboris]
MKTTDIRSVLNLFLAVLALSLWAIDSPASIYVQQDYKRLVSFSGDSSSYMRENFIRNQKYYKGKTLATVFTKLELPIVKLIPIGMSQVDGGPESCVGVTLYFNKNYIYFRNRLLKASNPFAPIPLIITFNKSFPFDKAAEMIRKYHGKLTDSVRSFYGKEVIDSISTVN